MSTYIKNENDSNLILYDISYFIEKYTRFMSKNIYISQSLHNFFFDQYRYLYENLEKEKLLYMNNSKYQKIITFQKNKDKFLKLHNVKYLKSACLKYQDFFDDLYSKDILDANKRNAILSMEQEMLFITSKNQIPLIVGKIKYLVDILKYSEEKILVLGTNCCDIQLLKQELSEKKQKRVSVFEIDTYKKSFLKEGETLLEEKTKYQILRDYLMNELFPNKQEFDSLYQAFKNAIYLNKDYKEFDTFSDYHNYMYKRKYLASGLSLKKYNEEEIRKRRDYLRTICNEVTNNKEEVDIANFLYLNYIPYIYHKTNSHFLLFPGDKDFSIFYNNDVQSSKVSNQENLFFLYKTDIFEKNFLEVLVYELIKRRYPLEKRSDQEIYNQLKETTKDSYFSNLIHHYFLPMIQFQKEHKNFEKTKLSVEQIAVFQNINTYYERYQQEFSFVEEDVLYQRMESSFHKKNYQYIIIWNQKKITPQNSYLRILEEYPEEPFLKENIKLSLDYKKYLTEYKKLPVLHAFTNMKEIMNLSRRFLKQNLDTINQSLSTNLKKVSVFLYDDSSRLLISKEIANVTSKIIMKKRKEKVLIGVCDLKDINLLIGKNTLSKVESNLLITQDGKKIIAEEIMNIKQISDIILLPYLILDSYHENLLDQYFEHKMKTMLFVALNKCKKEICLLCPCSKKEEFIQNLNGLQNIHIYEEV